MYLKRNYAIGRQVLTVFRGVNSTASTLTGDGNFAFAAPVASGANYAVTIKAQPKVPEQECTLSNGSGLVTNAPITSVSVTCKLFVARFAYVANSNDGTVSIFTVDATTGQLRPRGYALAGTGASAVAVAPAGKFAYVTNPGSNNVSIYTVDANNGALTSAGSVSGIAPKAIVIDPYGKFAYVLNSLSNTDTVSAYAIDSSTGSLTAVGAAVDTGNSSTSVAVDPSGRLVYRELDRCGGRSSNRHLSGCGRGRSLRQIRLRREPRVAGYFRLPH